MKVMVVGSGGREHAITWKLASEEGREVFVAPGNPGIALEENVTCTGFSGYEEIVKFAVGKRLSLVVVGPDQPLADGLVDMLEAAGVPAFGPTKAAARLESSKAYSKEVMKAAGIPTAHFETFHDFAAAKDFLERVEWGTGWVVKADGLALGKGVVVAETREQAIEAAEDFMAHDKMGAAGRTIVLEERLLGREASAFYLCDGERGIQIGYASDYKRIFDGNKGPNTGGMGSFSPADWMPSGTEELVERQILRPLLSEMKKRNAPYKGVIYIGLMVTDSGPKVIEFNARFGDPETQALLPLIDEDLLPWFQACRNGTLDKMPSTGPKKKKMHAVHVVMASHGYPGEVRKGDMIKVPQELLPTEGDYKRHAKLFMAGVGRKDFNLVTNGGRVLGLTALGESRSEARRIAYAMLETISFNGAQRRTDVGL